MSTAGTIRAGAWYGALAWAIYAVLEGGFTGILPWLIQRADLYQPLHFGFTAALFVLYPVIGAILTVGVGLPLAALGQRLTDGEIDRRKVFAATATCTVIAAFTLELLSRGFGPRNLVLAAGAAALVAAALARVISPEMNRKLAWVGNTWTAMSLLLGLTLVPRLMQRAIPVELALTGLYGVAVVLISYFLARAVLRGGATRRASALQLGIVTGCAIAVLGFTFACGRGFYYVDPPKTAIAPDQPGRPNVMLVVLDTVRADHTSLYGYHRDTTPNLKKLAERALVFEHAVSSSDWTLPSHASLFTGLYLLEHGVYCTGEDFGALDDESTTLAEALSQAGYNTLGVVANSGVRMQGFNLPQGFQYYAVRTPTLALSYQPKYVLRRRIASMIERLLPPEPNPTVYRDAGEITGEAIATLKDLKESENPFFLFLNYMDAHMPYDPPEPFANKYTDSSLMAWSDFRELEKKVMALKQELREEDQEQLIAHYDSGIEYVDAELGRLLEFMKQEKLFDNTLIVITSDHGEALGEHKTLEHGSSVYDEQIRVPLLIKTPDSQAGQRIPFAASGVDVMPTVLETVGVPVPDGLSGQNLLKPETAAREFVISETYPCGSIRRVHPRFDRVDQAVRSGSWKFVESSAGGRELYHIESDPLEHRNLYESNQQLASLMAATLETYRNRARSARSHKPAKLDRDAIEALKKLGYMQ